MKIQLITHNKCQLNCPPCIRTVLKPTKDVMSMETFYNIMEILPELENVDLTPIMGEPLLDKYLINRMDYLEKSNKVEHYDFVTNLLELTPEVLEKFFTYEKFGLFISIYGADNNTYNTHTGKEDRKTFQQFQKNFIMLYEKILEKKKLPFPLTFYFRFGKYESLSGDTWLKPLIRNLMLVFKNVTVDDSHANLNYNWGGQHPNVPNPAPIPKRDGECLHAIEQNCIFPNGDVSICGMVDVNKKMLTGNILKDGLSVFNYCKDNSRELCNGCSEYEPTF